MKRTRGAEAAAASAAPLATLVLKAAQDDPFGPTAAHLEYCGAATRELRAAEPYVVRPVYNALLELLPRAYAVELRPGPGSGYARMRRSPDNLAASLNALAPGPEVDKLTDDLQAMLTLNQSFAKVLDLGLPPLRASDFEGSVPAVGIIYGIGARVPADCVSSEVSQRKQRVPHAFRSASPQACGRPCRVPPPSPADRSALRCAPSARRDSLLPGRQAGCRQLLGHAC